MTDPTTVYLLTSAVADTVADELEQLEAGQVFMTLATAQREAEADSGEDLRWQHRSGQRHQDEPDDGRWEAVTEIGDIRYLIRQVVATP